VVTVPSSYAQGAPTQNEGLVVCALPIIDLGYLPARFSAGGILGRALVEAHIREGAVCGKNLDGHLKMSVPEFGSRAGVVPRPPTPGRLPCSPVPVPRVLPYS
jgi:hypothetical protein